MSDKCPFVRDWPTISEEDGCMVVAVYRNGHLYGRALRDIIDDDRKSKYHRCLSSLLDDTPKTVTGCTFNFVKGLRDGLHLGPEVERVELPDGKK